MLNEPDGAGDTALHRIYEAQVRRPRAAALAAAAHAPASSARAPAAGST